ncbi:hypothetical protein O3G_MSEX005287 [Manduca sexta]|uniref:unspecific monooxygenase n=1 Tax=Manduca sexta TaxID=7130 RepID=A0A921YXW0_MANSE|nr:hypothetical protein O3G_MSEX005287 [Manduca sexta]KAG6447916.1 hypothetical protein O3G_MSEX005287 [Manduca sexta]
MARKAIQSSFVLNLKFAALVISYKAGKFFNVQVFKKYEDFFITAIENVMQQRQADKIIRNDFIDHCITLQKNEVLRDSSTGYEIKPTTDVLAAQGFFFYIAGVDPSAAAMYATLAELGRHPEILQRVHDEIDETFEKHNGQLTHDVVQDMEYLDKVLSESMRMYPPIGFLNRECVEDSVLPVGNIKVEKGTKIFTPIYAIHYDEKYYPDAKVFNPDRFTKGGMQTTLSDSIYMPFGKGNRLCIGARYARLQVKAGLVHLLRHFSVETIVGPGGIKLKKEFVQLRPINLKVYFKPRDTKV